MTSVTLMAVATSALAVAQGALTPEPTTLQHVTTRGITMAVMGLQIPVAYTDDGKFTAAPPGTKVEGVWRIDGDSLCTKVGADPEVCVVYPAGKKPGDSFDVPGAMGPQMGTVRVTIR